MRNIYLLLALLVLVGASCSDSSDIANTVVSPYVAKVFDYKPAPGQFVNQLPEYEKGDNQEIMNEKVLKAIGGKANGMITLGGYGGYVVVGFDHTIQNVKGKRDFRVKGNAFYADNANGISSGSCEAGIIMVSCDKNKNGIPDDEWYEIAGSSHVAAVDEPWLQMAENKGNDVNFYKNYEITYHKPTVETEDVNTDYIKWEDNKDNSGFLYKNGHHNQSYYPQWIEADSLKFRGTRLPQNGVNIGLGTSDYYVLYQFAYGYADNYKDNEDGSAMDISWAVDAEGNTVDLDGIDFIKIYTGVNQVNGMLGESSTEIVSVVDLHVLGENIDTL